MALKEELLAAMNAANHDSGVLPKQLVERHWVALLHTVRGAAAMGKGGIDYRFLTEEKVATARLLADELRRRTEAEGLVFQEYFDNYSMTEIQVILCIEWSFRSPDQPEE